MWNRISAANKNIACQYPNDADESITPGRAGAAEDAG
jgi:hypothetical protein